MFRAYSTEGRKWLDVFDVSYDKTGFPLFLVYHNRQWMRRSAKHFVPKGVIEWGGADNG